MIVGLIIGAVAGFVAGILVGRRNKKTVETVVADANKVYTKVAEQAKKS